jgi:hypothetical protein
MSLILFALLAMILPFLGVLLISTALLISCSPCKRLSAIACFIVPAVLVPAGLVELGSISSVLRYSPKGPIIWFVVWPALGLACIGIIGAAFVCEWGIDSPLI